MASKPLPEPRTPPSVRHPQGLPRCRRIRRKNGQWLQCRRAAVWQLGLSVCGMHGGTWPVRVARRERRNPATARLVHGQRSQDATLDAALLDPATAQVARAEGCFRHLRALTNAVSAHLRLAEARRGKQKRGRPSNADREMRRLQRVDAMLAPVRSALTKDRTGPQ